MEAIPQYDVFLSYHAPDREAVAYLTGRPFGDGEGVYYAVQYLLKGALSLADMETIATGLLCNTLIQRYSVLSAAEFMARRGFPTVAPKVQVEVKVEVKEIDLEVPDGELMRISREGRPRRSASRARAVATQDFPLPPLPVTKRMRALTMARV